LLIQQSRYDLAEAELRQALGNDPENAEAHALLALVKIELGQKKEAVEEAEAAVGLDPDDAGKHYFLALVHHRCDRENEAFSAVQEAIRLDPEEAENYALLSSILLSKKKWKDALEASERGLAIDPENIECTNLRAIALVRLGRKSEAGATIEEALRSDPENAVTHANQGWTLLHKGEHEKAMGHFREALRLDPTSDWARSGIVEALKARNPIYKVMLSYFLWMSRLSAKARWGVIIGALVLYRVVSGITRSTPELRPLAYVALALYGCFFLLSWISYPLFNLVLRLNRFGRLALSKEDITASNWLGACIILALLSLVTGLLLNQTDLLWGAAVAAAMMVPVAGVFHANTKKGRLFLALYAVALATAGALGVALSLTGDPSAGTFGTVFLLGWVAFSWIGNMVH
jgi:tetratricopeptide (TPR) repeat protein